MTWVTEVLRVARGEVGYVETPNNITKYWAAYAPHYQGSAWCARFVSWCYREAGYSLPDIDSNGGYVGVQACAAYARRNGRLRAEPVVGSAALYTFGQWHTGIVCELLSGGYFRAIEGNTSPGTGGSQTNGGGVYVRTRHVNDTHGGGGFYLPFDVPSAQPTPAVRPPLPTRRAMKFIAADPTNTTLYEFNDIDNTRRRIPTPAAAAARLWTLSETTGRPQSSLIFGALDGNFFGMYTEVR